jgi:hypothetical protein
MSTNDNREEKKNWKISIVYIQTSKIIWVATSPRDRFHWHSQRLSFLEISKRLFLHFTEKNPNLLLSLSDQKTRNSKSLKGFQSLPVLLTIESESPKSKNRLVFLERNLKLRLNSLCLNFKSFLKMEKFSVSMRDPMREFAVCWAKRANTRKILPEYI